MSAGAPTIIVLPDADALARAVAARLLTRLAEAQAARGSASLVLTGGGIGIDCLRAVLAAESCSSVDWTHVDMWWGDERFLAAGDAERNETQARAALLDHLDVSKERVHPVPSAHDHLDVDQAAARYAQDLQAAAPSGQSVPAFDVLLLGMGPEGHTASIFPGSPAAHDDRPVFAVRDCPKPPPTRVSMGFSALNTARESWMVVSGGDKAAAVRAALSGTDRVHVPAAGVRGREKTLWLLDAEAAADLD